MTSRGVDDDGGHGTPFTPGNSGRPPNLPSPPHGVRSGEDHADSRDHAPTITAVTSGQPHTPDPKVERLIQVVNGLSDDAVYIASRDWFGSVVMGKPVLAAAQNDRQQRAFDELFEAGFVHGDVERGVNGYRSTWDGRRAAPFCRAAITTPAGGSHE